MEKGKGNQRVIKEGTLLVLNKTYIILQVLIPSEIIVPAVPTAARGMKQIHKYRMSHFCTKAGSQLSK